MKKSELVTLVAEKTGFSKKDTEKTIDTVFTAIADIMAAGDKLQVSGFGTFETKERAARTGHNPRTGEEINIDSDIRLAITASIREHFAEHPDHFDPRQYLKPARQAVKDMVTHKLINVLGCNGKA